MQSLEMLCINLQFVPGEVSKITFHFRIKIHCFKYLIKVYFKILSMTLTAFFPFFQRVMEKLLVASLLVLDKLCTFVLNLSTMFLLTIDNLL